MLPYLEKVLSTAKTIPGDHSTEYTIRCGKHDQIIHFVLYDNDMIFAKYPDHFLVDKIREALRNCPGCITEQEYAKSRFPEGAEI